jgi:hypothetical protein
MGFKVLVKEVVVRVLVDNSMLSWYNVKLSLNYVWVVK